MLAVIIFTGDKICRLVDTGSPASVVGIATKLLAEMSGSEAHPDSCSRATGLRSRG